MDRRNKNLLHNIDWWTVIIYLVLVFFGWLNVYAAVYDGDHSSIFDFSCRYGKQIIWIGAALVIALFVIILDPKFFTQSAYVIYGIFLLMLVAVLVVGSETKGAKSWFGVGDFGIQPSEFAKGATALALAKVLSSIDADFSKWRTKIASIFVIVVPMLLVFLQNDTGSALVFVSFVFVLFREGLSAYVLVFGAALIVLFVSALLIDKYILVAILFALCLVAWLVIKRKSHRTKVWLFLVCFLISSAVVFAVDVVFDKGLEQHQKDRIEVLLGKKEDLKGVGYNVNQSKIAIGSGGFLGKGFLNGTQTKYNFVPEQDTDFIFCTIGEEWGFIGSSITIILFLTLCIRLVKMAERQRSKFARIYGYGVASIIFFHFFVNIGMTIGLLPVIGIPLPFISYGGSSLWAFTLLLFIFIRQDASRLELI
ncbi:MAG: rod shape-determining protein RodA [Bacteroidales bacterium]|nr:rod shape-determining protein RodA [Bacteroidales bacterium]